MGRPKEMVLEKDLNNVKLIKDELDKWVKFKKKYANISIQHFQH